MLANQYRFHGHRSLRFVYHKGQTARGQMMSLKYVQNTRRPVYRAAVVVSKKVDKSAVVRNRIRRRVYEVIRSLSPQFVDTPYDMVFTVYSPAVATITHQELTAMVQSQLRQAKILSNK
jgi:ribonuclease P protein component